MLEVTETIECRGHVNITGKHKTTFEITKEPHLSKRGTCIIGVSASKGAFDLSSSFKKILNSPGSILTTTLSCGGILVTIQSEGGPNLSLNHKTDIVWRKSNFTCDRTIGVMSNFSAVNIPRQFIELLKNEAGMTVILNVRSGDGSGVALPWEILDFPE